MQGCAAMVLDKMIEMVKKMMKKRTVNRKKNQKQERGNRSLEEAGSYRRILARQGKRGVA